MLKAHFAAYLLATALASVPAMAQTTTAPAPNPPAGTTTPAKVNAAEFVSQAATSGMFEIQSSELALSKSRDDRVRDFAQRMVKDHTEASHKLKTAAGSTNVPTSLDAEHSKMLQQLQQASGNDFTRNYVQRQFEGHQKAVALFNSYAQSGDNPQLKQFAQETAPTLRDHLQHISQIRQSMLGTDRMAQNQGKAPTDGANYLTQSRPDLWRASKLTGLNVYNENDEKIGDINEVLVDRDGKAEAVVIGVGGFLGLGERDVAVPFSALRWEMNARAAAASGTSPGTGVSTTGSTMATGSDTRGYPDHAILPNASKDQLKNAPQFRYGNL
jgi:putative membrane protein